MTTGRAAETDAKILAAAETLAGRAFVTRADLAAAAGVAPQTAGASVERLRARGEWHHPFPASAQESRASFRGRMWAGRAPSAGPHGGGVAPSAYLRTAGRGEPVDMVKAREFCADILAVWDLGNPWDRLEVAGLVGNGAKSLSGAGAEAEEAAP